jgi:hypothetical protein
VLPQKEVNSITPLLMMITIVGYDELAESISECYSLLIKWSCWLTIAIHFLLHARQQAVVGELTFGRQMKNLFARDLRVSKDAHHFHNNYTKLLVIF